MSKKTKSTGNYYTDYILYSITSHGGKMEGIPSISTYRDCNPYCEKHRKVSGSVCEKCYVTNHKYKATMIHKLERNTKFYTNIKLEPEDIPHLNYAFFRFESFGDLMTELQFKNYALIAEKNPQCTFALWTKNPDVIANAIDTYGIEKPKNLIIIVSSIMINHAFNYDNLKKTYPFIDKIFSVYDDDAIRNQCVPINCGPRDCMGCRKCYTHNGVMYINEKLK